MHVASRASPCLRGELGLRNDRLQPMFAELVLAEGAREEPPLVELAVEIDDEGAFKLCLGKDHYPSPALRDGMRLEPPSRSMRRMSDHPFTARRSSVRGNPADARRN